MLWRENFFAIDHVNVILSGHRKIEAIKNTKHVKNVLKNLSTYIRNNLISRGELLTMLKLSGYYQNLQTEKKIPVKGAADYYLENSIKT